LALGVNKDGDTKHSKALEALSTFPNVTVEYEKKDLSTMSLISKSTQFGVKDLVVVSHDLYMSSQTTDSYHFWLDNVSKCSYVIVKSPVPQPSSSSENGRRRPRLNRNLSDYRFDTSDEPQSAPIL
jgi:hypothetical protein